ncbi:MAG: hypothetical protein OEX02_16530 [Cyclobacteriaceae bacterium]|nr:hypothetical protein [Cyclobacteriaceae bacterium]
MAVGGRLSAILPGQGFLKETLIIHLIPFQLKCRVVGLKGSVNVLSLLSHQNFPILLSIFYNTEQTLTTYVIT